MWQAAHEGNLLRGPLFVSDKLFTRFISGEKWKPGNEIFGVLPFILGSIYVTAGALIIGLPAGLLTAIFMSRFASKRIVKVMRPAVSLLAGIPSVVYGFFGLVALAPLVREVLGGTGSSLLTACVLLGMMILPMITTVSESVLNAVPSSYYEGERATVEIGQAYGKIRCTVSDNGIGIPRAHQEHVFERFYRVDKSHSHATGGTGLGLAIVKHVAEIHHAELALHSQEGEGIAITLDFPASAPSD